jgi:hypothetical protein
MDIFDTIYTLLPIAIGLYYYFHLLRIMKNGIVVKVRVIKNEEKWHFNNGNLYYKYAPHVFFVTEDGREIKAKLEFSTQIQLYNTGEFISIVYDKNNPYKATKFIPWLPMTILLSSIAITLLIHLIIYLFKNGYLRNL